MMALATHPRLTHPLRVRHLGSTASYGLSSQPMGCLDWVTGQGLTNNRAAHRLKWSGFSLFLNTQETLKRHLGCGDDIIGDSNLVILSK